MKSKVVYRMISYYVFKGVRIRRVCNVYENGFMKLEEVEREEGFGEDENEMKLKVIRRKL